MSQVEFEEPKFINQNYMQPNQSGLIGYLIRNNWTKSTASANVLLVSVASAFLLAASIIYYVFIGNSTNNTKINLSENAMNRLPIEIQNKIRNSQQ